MTKKNKVNRAWVNRHVTDHYVNMAQKDGYRSRAAYKLLEFDDEFHIFKNVKTVVDLGCAPGSWSQVATQKVGKSGLVIGVDLLSIVPIHNLNFIEGDFTESETLDKLIELLNNNQADLVISDMAPNLSGVRGVDQARISYLVELVLDFAKDYLKVGGDALIKVFHGGDFDNLVKTAREIFAQVLVKKPNASRSESSEIYLLCRNKL